MVICLEQGADMHIAQLMPLSLTVSCFSKIQIGFTFLVPAHLDSPRQRAVKQVCVCVIEATFLNETCTMSLPRFLKKWVKGDLHIFHLNVAQLSLFQRNIIPFHMLSGLVKPTCQIRASSNL